MTKPTNTELETRITRPTPRLHIVTQPKGGIGKTFVSRILAEYLNAPAFDSDTESRQLLTFSPHLKVKTINLTTPSNSKDYPDQRYKRTTAAGTIDYDAMNVLHDHIVTQQLPDIILDCGAQIYGPLRDFMTESDMPNTLASDGIEIWFHPIICGGPQQDSTLIDAMTLCRQWCPPNGPAKAILWENEHEDHVRSPPIPGQNSLHGIQNLEVWSAIAPLIQERIVVLHQYSPAYQRDIGKYISAPRSGFLPAITSSETPAFTRTRLKTVWMDINKQLDTIFQPRTNDDNTPSPLTLDQMQQLATQSASQDYETQQAAQQEVPSEHDDEDPPASALLDQRQPQ